MTIADECSRTDVTDAIVQHAKSSIAAEFDRTMEEYLREHTRDESPPLLAQEAMLRLLKSDSQFARRLEDLARQPNDELDIDQLAIAPVLEPNDAPGQQIMNGSVSHGTKFLYPPFNEHFRSPEAHGAASAGAKVVDDRTLRAIGTMHRDGSFYAKAAVYVMFQREAGTESVGTAWITPNVNVKYWWVNRPALGIAALAGGMGVQVNSYDSLGGSHRLEMPYSHTFYEDQRVLFDQSRSIVFPFFELWSSTKFNGPLPSFTIRPDRFYIATIMCGVQGWARNMAFPGNVTTVLHATVKSIGVDQT